MTPGDDAAGEMKQAEVVGELLAPADQDGAEAVQPGVCPLHHPTSGFRLGMTPGGDLLAAGAQVQGKTELFGQGTWLGIVVAFAQAEVLRLLRRRLVRSPQAMARRKERKTAAVAGPDAGSGHSAPGEAGAIQRVHVPSG